MVRPGSIDPLVLAVLRGEEPPVKG
jgi:hypothetical protein